MTDNGSDTGQHFKRIRHPIGFTLLTGGVFVLLLAAMIYVGSRLETLEDQLRFTPPAVPEKTATAPFAIDMADAQTVYVPVYSHIYARGGEPHLLEITLSIRNTDPEHAIDIAAVRYFDTKGNLIQDYLVGPLRLAPLETTAFLVEKSDARGGSGANFIVAWNAEKPVYEPIIEAVMIGVSQHHSISFTSPGRPLLQRESE